MHKVLVAGQQLTIAKNEKKKEPELKENVKNFAFVPED